MEERITKDSATAVNKTFVKEEIEGTHLFLGSLGPYLSFTVVKR
jgi:hypothetical protein